jgi:hypothetical protein
LAYSVVLGDTSTLCVRKSWIHACITHTLRQVAFHSLTQIEHASRDALLQGSACVLHLAHYLNVWELYRGTLAAGCCVFWLYRAVRR